jgi:uncharacterized membrane protein YfcA
MSIEIAIFLAIASGFAGFVDAMAGGGGLIQLPALLVGLPNKELPLILGTNKELQLLLEITLKILNQISHLL